MQLANNLSSDTWTLPVPVLRSGAMSLLAAETRFYFQDSAICDGQSNIVTVFSTSMSVSVTVISPPMLRACYNRPLYGVRRKRSTAVQTWDGNIFTSLGIPLLPGFAVLVNFLGKSEYSERSGQEVPRSNLVRHQTYSKVKFLFLPFPAGKWRYTRPRPFFRRVFLSFVDLQPYHFERNSRVGQLNSLEVAT
jgi:hypothetical protein